VLSEHTALLLPTAPARAGSTTQDLTQSPAAAAAAAGRGGEAQHGCRDQGKAVRKGVGRLAVGCAWSIGQRTRKETGCTLCSMKGERAE
jgi:hypothetical protein